MPLMSEATLITCSLKTSDKPLSVEDAEGVLVSIIEAEPDQVQQNLDTLHRQPGMRTLRLPIVRPAKGVFQHIANWLNPSHLYITEWNPNYFDFKIYHEDDFASSSVKEQVEQHNLSFAVNANFYSLDYEPLGMVFRGGKQQNPRRPDWTGWFFVKDGVPYAGPTSLLDSIKGEWQEAVQAYPSLMKNGTVFNYLSFEESPFFNAKKLSYRSLAGMRKDGTIVFILSEKGGILNIREIAALAKKLDLWHATLFDGGRALQYQVQMEGYEHAFRTFYAYPDLSFISRKLRPARSPVYIGITDKK